MTVDTRSMLQRSAIISVGFPGRTSQRESRQPSTGTSIILIGLNEYKAAAIDANDLVCGRWSSDVLAVRRTFFLKSTQFPEDSCVVVCQWLTFGLCATSGFASVSPNCHVPWEALAEPVAPEIFALTNQ